MVETGVLKTGTKSGMNMLRWFTLHLQQRYPSGTTNGVGLAQNVSSFFNYSTCSRLGGPLINQPPGKRIRKPGAKPGSSTQKGPHSCDTPWRQLRLQQCLGNDLTIHLPHGPYYGYYGHLWSMFPEFLVTVAASKSRSNQATLIMLLHVIQKNDPSPD